MKIGNHNIKSLIGQTFKLKSLNRYDGHASEDYSKDWIGREVTILNDCGLVQFENGECRAFLFPFNVEEIKTTV